MTRAPIRILASFGTVGGWTMMSRILGFIRDILIGALVGTGPVAEAFIVAFRLPNMFRRFFAEGAFNLAFIPLFSKKLSGEGESAARDFAEEALSVLLTILIALTVVAQAIMPWLVWVIAGGFEAGSDREELAVLFSRICFPYILFISLAALFSGIANGYGRFAAAAAAPVLLNLVWIAGMALGAWLGWEMGLTLAWSVFVGGVGQLILMVVAVRRLGVKLGLRLPRLSPDVRRLIALAIPAVLIGGVTQINLIVGTRIASATEGAVGWLYFADRIYQLPLGVIGVAIGVVLLPALSHKVQEGDHAGAASAMNRAAEFALILTLPAAAALIALPELISRVLFERLAFTAEDSRQTALALWIYAIGLPSFVLHKVLQPAFIAREDMRTPLRYAIIAMVVNVVVAIGLYPLIGWVGAPIGTTVAGWLMIFLLWNGARRLESEMRVDTRLADRWWRMVLASAAMAGVVLGLEILMAQAGIISLLRLLFVVPAGLVCYALFAILLGAFRLSDIRSAVGRGG
ncbi:MAG: murein biosynthesis integral membrane protein MurJ [Pseudomonadota bacterium]